MGLVKCATEGCGAKVVVGQNTECERHRPRVRSPSEKSYDTPEKQRARAARRRRRRDAAGVLWA